MWLNLFEILVTLHKMERRKKKENNDAVGIIHGVFVLGYIWIVLK